MPKHKHAKVIKAWADGAEIEYRTDPNCQWKSHPCNTAPHQAPSFSTDWEYRVKPAPHKWQKEMDAAREGKTIQWDYADARKRGWETWACAKASLEKSVTGIHVGWDDSDYIFRIKPESVKQYAKLDEYSMRWGVKEEANVCFTFEDGKLVKAEVLPVVGGAND